MVSATAHRALDLNQLLDSTSSAVTLATGLTMDQVGLGTINTHIYAFRGVCIILIAQ